MGVDDAVDPGALKEAVALESWRQQVMIPDHPRELRILVQRTVNPLLMVAEQEMTLRLPIPFLVALDPRHFLLDRIGQQAKGGIAYLYVRFVPLALGFQRARQVIRRQARHIPMVANVDDGIGLMLHDPLRGPRQVFRGDACADLRIGNDDVTPHSEPLSSTKGISLIAVSMRVKPSSIARMMNQPIVSTARAVTACPPA